MSDLSQQVHGGLAIKNRPDAPPELAQTGALANIAEIEDSVDAMGTVVFADEEDCGFFGRTTFFFSEMEPAACKMKEDID